MIIESIELKNYRNYEELHMELNEGTNILYGDNAQGKTNILEAVYVCCTSKSHKNAKDRDIIRFDQDESHIKMQIRKNDAPYRIDMHLKKNKPKGADPQGQRAFRHRQRGVLFSRGLEYYQEWPVRTQKIYRYGTGPVE